MGEAFENQGLVEYASRLSYFNALPLLWRDFFSAFLFFTLEPSTPCMLRVLVFRVILGMNKARTSNASEHVNRRGKDRTNRHLESLEPFCQTARENRFPKFHIFERDFVSRSILHPLGHFFVHSKEKVEHYDIGHIEGEGDIK